MNKKARKLTGNTRQNVVGVSAAQWTCSSCGHVNVTDSQAYRACANCGHSHDSTEKYGEQENVESNFLSADAQKEHGFTSTKKKNEECQYCHSEIKPGETTCPNCGSDLTQPAPAITPTPVRESFTYQKPVKGRNWLAIIGGVVLFLVLAGLLFYVFKPRTVIATVDHVEWSASVKVEEKRYVQQSGWDYPADAEQLKSENKTHHNVTKVAGQEVVVTPVYEVVATTEACHATEICDEPVWEPSGTLTTECHDDGSCTTTELEVQVQYCQEATACANKEVYDYVDREFTVDVIVTEPVVQPYYTYWVWRWFEADTLKTSGKGHTFAWPEFTATETLRHAGQNFELIVTFKKEGKTYEWEVDSLEEFAQFSEGSEWQLTTVAGTLTKVEMIK